MFVAAFVLSLALIQDPAAQAPAQPAVQMSEEERQRAEEEAYLDEVICRREHVVGSNRPQRICQTRRQWNHLRDESMERLSDGRSRSYENHLSTAGAGR